MGCFCFWKGRKGGVRRGRRKGKNMVIVHLCCVDGVKVRQVGNEQGIRGAESG